MIRISPLALPHLLAAADQERQRLIAIEEEAGKDWPDGFDANDIYLFADAMEAIRFAMHNGKSDIDLSGKVLWFLLGPLPGYVEANNLSLSTGEYEALKAAYSHHPERRKTSFPERE